MLMSMIYLWSSTVGGLRQIEMALRDNIFQQFGPKLTEAFFLALLRELNEVRTSIGKQPLTAEYLLGRLHNDLNHIDDYDWMNDEEP